MTAISLPLPFNTTNVRALDNIGKLYKIDVPLSESAAAGEALVYSTTALTNNKPAPNTAIFLRTTDANDSYFSVNRTDNQTLNLVASGDSLNLYVFTKETMQQNGSMGHLDKYTFDSTGVLQSQRSLTNSIEIAREEQLLSVPRDLDANLVVGGKLSSTGTLDTIGSMYKVNVAGENVFIVGTSATTKSKIINVTENALKSGDVDEDGKQKAWQPEGTFTSYNAFKNESDNTWDIFAYNNTQKSVTQFSFDANKVLLAEFKDGKVLSTAEVAREEISRNRNLNGDSVLGVNIATLAIDAKGGLFKASIQGEDYYLVGENLKSSKNVAGAVSLSSALINESGDTSWLEPSGTTIRSIVQSTDKETGARSVQVYATKPTGIDLDPQVLKFNFNFDGKNFVLDSDSQGIILTAFELASAEKSAERDLDKVFKYLDKQVLKDEFGISVLQSLDKVGGLSLASSMGQKYLVSGNNVVSNSKKITDLTNALTVEGGAWMPEGFNASEVIQGALTGKISIVLDGNLKANVYVNEGNSISKYYFERELSSTPWSTDGTKSTVSNEELASLEKTTRRDLNGDGFFGAKIVEEKNAAGRLYAASYSSLGASSSDSSKIYIRSDYKLALGGTIANNAVDFSNALISSDGYWAPPAGYKITGAFRDGDTYSVIVKNDSNLSDIKKYTFDILDQTTTTLIESDTEGFTYDISAKDLSALEFNLKRDLNADGIAGVKIKGNPADKLGGLYKVQGADGDYYVNKPSSSPITNLDNAFFDENSNRWVPSTESGFTVKKLTLHISAALSAPNEYWIFQSEIRGSETVYSKYKFDENHKQISKSQLSLTDLANEESAIERDINGDGVFGAKVISTIKANSGIYKVALDGKFMLVAPGTATTPVRMTDLSTVLMTNEEKPLEISTDGLLVNSEFNGFRVFSGTISTNSEGLNSVKIFAIKTNTTGVGQAYNDVKMLTFTDNALPGSISPNYVLSTNQDLTAEEIIAEEKISGFDLNADKAVGVKIDEVIDKKAGLYSSKILGQTYYFVDSPNKKTGTNSSNAIDLTRAFYDKDSNPWNASSSTVAGIVALTNLQEKIIGYDIYTYTESTSSAKTEYSVTKHSWTLDDTDGLVYKSASEVDTAELVKVEVAQKRDFSGDRVVGFRTVDYSDTDPRYEGVTKVAVLGNSTESFYVVGKNLRPGTPTNPWKLSDALLNQDGTGAWSIPNANILNQTIAAVRDVNSTDRFVYVKTPAADVDTPAYITKYKFKKADGTYTGESQRMSDISLAAEELNSKRDLNGDTKLGVTQVTDVRLSTKEYGSGEFFIQNGKSSGLIKATINNNDYLVVKKAPNNNTLLNLDLALVDANGAWKPSDNFTLLGVYKNAADETEIYGTDVVDIDTGTRGFKKYTFSITDFKDPNPWEEDSPGITSKVLMLNTDVPTTTTNRSIRERENEVGKDLNNDNVLGFVIDRSSLDQPVNKISSLANGTTLAKSTDDVGEIYVVGKSVATMGAAANRTANQNALRESIEDGQRYWAPDNGYVVKSILEDTASRSIKVYATFGTDQTSMREYSFTREEGTGTEGWLTRTSATDLNSLELVTLEMNSLKDLNGDKAIGLLYADPSSQPISGLIKATLGNSNSNVGSVSSVIKNYYFAMTQPKASSNIGIDTAKLLTNEANEPWQPSGDVKVFSPVASADNAPEGAAYAARTLTQPLTFFSSAFQQLPA